MAKSASGPLTNRQAQGEQSRQEILDAAEQLMAARGYDGTSISEIARASGLPASSLYWHFGSKAGLLDAIVERGSARFFAAVERVAVPDGATPRDRIELELTLASRAIRAESSFLRLMMLLVLSGRNDETMRRVRRQGRERLWTMIAEAYGTHGPDTAGQLADQLADLALAIFDGSFLAVQHDPQHDHLPLLMRMADAIVTLADASINSAVDGVTHPAR